MISAGKNCILFAYCFEPCYYPVACFTVIPLNRKTRMEKPLHGLCLVIVYFNLKISYSGDRAAPWTCWKTDLFSVTDLYSWFLKQWELTLARLFLTLNNSSHTAEDLYHVKTGLCSVLELLMVSLLSWHGPYMMNVVHIMFFVVLDMTEVNTGCIPLGSHKVPGWSRMGNGRFSLFTLDLCPAMLNPSAFLSSQGHQPHFVPMQQSNGVGNIRVRVANTGLMGIKQTPSPCLRIKHEE